MHRGRQGGIRQVPEFDWRRRGIERGCLAEKHFLKYNMDYEDFESAGLTWEELQAIHDNYRGLERKLRGIGKDFVDEYLYDIEKAGIHSYRYRTKEPGHLIEKIIRKKE